MNTLKKLIYNVFFGKSTARKLEPCGFHHRVGGTLKTQIRWILHLFASQLITLMGKTLGSLAMFADHAWVCVFWLVCFGQTKHCCIRRNESISPWFVCFLAQALSYIYEIQQREAATHASLSSALLRSIFLSVQIALPRRRDTPTTCAPDPLHPSLVTAGTSHTPTLSIIRSPRAFGTWALDFGGVWFFTVFGTRCRENDCANLFALVITESWACILHEAKAYPMFLINMHTTRVTFAKFDSGGGFDTLFAMFYYPLCQFL